MLFVLCYFFHSANRDGLLFELENGKPKLTLLNAGEYKLVLVLTHASSC